MTCWTKTEIHGWTEDTARQKREQGTRRLAQQSLSSAAALHCEVS